MCVWRISLLSSYHAENDFSFAEWIMWVESVQVLNLEEEEQMEHHYHMSLDLPTNTV